MARTWLQIKVELLAGRGIDCDPPPGRVFIVGPAPGIRMAGPQNTAIKTLIEKRAAASELVIRPACGAVPRNTSCNL